MNIYMEHSHCGLATWCVDRLFTTLPLDVLTDWVPHWHLMHWQTGYYTGTWCIDRLVTTLTLDVLTDWLPHWHLMYWQTAYHTDTWCIDGLFTTLHLMYWQTGCHINTWCIDRLVTTLTLDALTDWLSHWHLMYWQTGYYTGNWWNAGYYTETWYNWWLLTDYLPHWFMMYWLFTTLTHDMTGILIGYSHMGIWYINWLVAAFTGDMIDRWIDWLTGYHTNTIIMRFLWSPHLEQWPTRQHIRHSVTLSFKNQQKTFLSSIYFS